MVLPHAVQWRGGGKGARGPFSTQRYIHCAKKCFGATIGNIPGTDKSVLGFTASTDVVLASEATGEPAAVIGATLLAESNGIMYPVNQSNSQGGVDVGPMQLNAIYLGDDQYHPVLAYGFDLTAGHQFEGDPYINILAGAEILKSLGNSPWNYVGRGSAGAAARKTFLNMMVPKLKPFFDCLTAK